MEKEKIEQIFFGTSVSDKLTKLKVGAGWDEQYNPIDLPSSPGNINISSQCPKVKFPKLDRFKDDEAKAHALHFFANHELQAINMMCAILLIIPQNNTSLRQFKKGILKSLIDEQKHFSLYLKRMKDFGLEYGSFKQSDFFWKQMVNIDTPDKFNSVMALTLESANLDFSSYYRNVFAEHEDFETAAILDIVLEDEIDHVRIGYNWLSKKYPKVEMWDLYNEILPFPLSPSRSKGDFFNTEARIKAGLSTDFISKVKNHKEDFKIVNRRKWKK